jgi:hypothetical protein
VYGALGLAVALALKSNVLETMKLGYSIFAAGLILPVLAALLLPAGILAPRGAIVAMVAGGATAAIGRFLRLAGGVDPVLLGTAVNFVVLALSFLIARVPSSISRLRA